MFTILHQFTIFMTGFWSIKYGMDGQAHPHVEVSETEGISIGGHVEVSNMECQSV